MLGGVGVVPLQREAGQRAQVIYGEEMPVESQPPGGGIGGSGSIGGLAQRPDCSRINASAPISVLSPR